MQKCAKMCNYAKIKKRKRKIKRMKFRLVEDNLEEYDNEGNKLTQEQINFFRNSKIRAKNGSLMVCYHGTSANLMSLIFPILEIVLGFILAH